MLTGLVTQLGYFETWDGGVIPSTDPGGLAYYPPSGNLVLADTEINEIAEFQGDNLFVISLSGDTLVQEIASGNKEPTGITYNEFDGFFYISNDDNNTVQRYDTNLNNPLATVFTTVDVPNADDAEGITSDPSTGYLYVIDGIGGGIQVLAYDSDLVFEYRFSVAGQLTDPEGIAFNPNNQHLYIISEADNLIAEYALNGAFVEQYDTSGLTPNGGSLQGLTFAPTSDPLDDPNNLALYIADGGIDNFADGGIYEVLLSDAQFTQNTAPLVNAGGTQELLLSSFPVSSNLNAAVADDGLPSSPAAVTTLWTQVSGPATASFADATVVDPTVTFTAAGTYVLRLTADDGNLTISDDTTIEVKLGVEIQVTTSSDDAEERVATGKIFLTGADLDFGTDAGSTTPFDQLVGLRFPGISIPQGATISKAYIQFRADETDAIATLLTIAGEDTDDAPTFTSVSGDISSRSTTLASATWSPNPWTKGDSGLDQRTPDISNVIQDIINRPGWTTNNALAIILSGTGERVAEPYDGNVPMFAPLLHIEFFTPGVTINPSGGTTDLTEGGATDTYDVVLNSPPKAGTTVTITLGTADGQTTTNPTSLVFDENNWNIAQTVTVTAVDDGLVEGSPHSGTITHTASSTDSDYDGITIDSVDANISEGKVFTVNSFADTGDANLGDGLAEDALGNTTLRAAIMEANAITGPITIVLPSGVYDNSGGQYEITDTTGSLTIVGAGADSTTITGSNRAFNIAAGATLSVSGLTMAGTGTGSVQRGQGIYNQGTLNLQNSVLRNYTALLEGGAVYNAFGGVVSITDSTIADNFAPDQGGGIKNDNGILTMVRSTFSGNATGGGATQGGGAIWTNSTVVISNSTISDNTGSDSGGIYSTGLSIVAIVSSTITNNSAGIRHEGNGIFSIGNTVVAGNVTDFTGSGTITSGGYNFIGDVGTAAGLVDGVNGDQVGSVASPLDPLLGPLLDNGGPTLTHWILAGSPLINAGDPSYTTPPDFDQRGSLFDRITFGQIDIGAVELDATSTAVSADFDGDALVSGNDFLSWQRGFGISSGASTGDGDATGDGKVTSGDLAAWESSYGAGPISATATGSETTSSTSQVDESLEPQSITLIAATIESLTKSINQVAENLSANYDGLLAIRDISFASIRDGLSHEMRSSLRHRDLSKFREASDKVFSEYANRRVLPEQPTEINLQIPGQDDYRNAVPQRSEMSPIDDLYNELGNSFSEIDTWWPDEPTT